QPNAGHSVKWYMGNTEGGIIKASNFPAVSLQPQKLDVLGSIKAPECSFLNYANSQNTDNTGVNMSGTGIYHNASAWCSLTAPSQITLKINTISLPENIFLICGDRAWKVIPGKAEGDPWTFSHLTMFHPSLETLTYWALQHNCLCWYSWHALNTIIKLGCWLAKESNAT
ncbi:hypothetical protein Nmel_007599, partial [Mimus melanotis]